MVSRREHLQEGLRVWRAAQRELDMSGDGNVELERAVDRLRDEYQRIYSETMTENLHRLHEADARRAEAVPSTPAFHEATQDTETIAADIWEQARRGDRDTPNGSGDRRADLQQARTDQAYANRDVESAEVAEARARDTLNAAQDQARTDQG